MYCTLYPCTFMCAVSVYMVYINWWVTYRVEITMRVYYSGVILCIFS